MTPQARQTTKAFLEVSGKLGLHQGAELHGLGIRRQAFLGTAGLYVAGLLGLV